jgi:hypothetical protein
MTESEVIEIISDVTKRVVDQITYTSHPEWAKDYWINLLFEIADKIREI